MSTAHLLSGLDPRRDERLQRMATVLGLLGYTPTIYDESVCNKTHAANSESQLNAVDGMRVSYADNMAQKLSKLPQGDIIIATADWHHQVFRGTLPLYGGRYSGTPVVEMWVDYPGCFAQWVTFASAFTMNYELGRLGFEEWNPRWIVASPYIVAEEVKPATVGVYHSDPPHSLRFLERMGHSVIPIAPDYGVWHELIEHGKNGFLYRSEEGRKLAEESVLWVNAKEMLYWLTTYYSAENAALALRSYLDKVTDAGKNHRS